MNIKKIKKIILSLILTFSLNTVSLNAKNNVIQNNFTSSLNNLIYLENSLKDITKIYLNKKQYDKIRRIDPSFGGSLSKAIKGYIQLNKILVEGLDKYIKRNSLNLTKKEYQELKLKTGDYKKLIDEYINVINKTKVNLKDRANYLLLLESIKNILDLEFKMIYMLKQYNNMLLNDFLNTKIDKILKNHPLLKNYTFGFLVDVYYKKLYFLLETEEERVIKDKINGLSSFTRRSMKDKYLLRKVKEYNKNGIFNDLISSIKQESIFSINQEFEDETKASNDILNGIKKEEKEHGKRCYETSPGIKFCETY